MSAIRHATSGRRRGRPFRLEARTKSAILDGFGSVFSFGMPMSRQPIDSPLTMAVENFQRISARVALRLGIGREWTFDELVTGVAR